MSVYTIKCNKNKAKMMCPVQNREEYLKLRDSALQKSNLKAIRNGNEGRKRWLVQMNYSCLPNEDGSLKGSTRMSSTVGMDIDWTPSPLPHEGEEQIAARKEEWLRKVPELVLAKKEELGLLMLERSATKGYHLVFRRRPELSQEENLKWASDLLGVDFDKGAKDITRVFYTTTGSGGDLLFLDDAIFEVEEVVESERVRKGEGESTQKEPSLLCNQPSFKGRPYSEIIDAWWQRNGGVPQEGERNVKLYQLAVNLRAICDNNKTLLLQVMPRLGLDEQELQSIVDSACKETPKGLSRPMREILAMEEGNNSHLSPLTSKTGAHRLRRCSMTSPFSGTSVRG